MARSLRNVPSVSQIICMSDGYARQMNTYLLLNNTSLNDCNAFFLSDSRIRKEML
jgi:hypothetical protein